ncbi:MAG: hypothetical protein ABIQ99_05970, partial [Thermoflexales bacterium]
LRTRGAAGNWNAGAVHLGPFLIDTIVPYCEMIRLPEETVGLSVMPSWYGDDRGSGLANFDLLCRAGADGTWTPWLTAATETQAAFGPYAPVALTPGQTYYFGCQARDAAGNLEAWPGGDGDTFTRVIFNRAFLLIASRGQAP